MTTGIGERKYLAAYGNGHPNLVRYRIYPIRDGQLVGRLATMSVAASSLDS